MGNGEAAMFVERKRQGTSPVPTSNCSISPDNDQIKIESSVFHIPAAKKRS